MAKFTTWPLELYTILSNSWNMVYMGLLVPHFHTRFEGTRDTDSVMDQREMLYFAYSFFKGSVG